MIVLTENDIDKVMIDPWSGNHAASGLILGSLNISDSWCFYLAVLWEIFENLPTGHIFWKLLGFPNYTDESPV